MLEFINRWLINKMNSQLLIYCNEHLCISLTNNNLITITEYLEIQVDIEGVKATIKAWFVNVEFSDLVIVIPYMRRLGLSKSYVNKKIMVWKQYIVPIGVLTKLFFIQIDLIKIDLLLEKNTTMNELCWSQLDGLRNEMLWLLVWEIIRAIKILIITTYFLK